MSRNAKRVGGLISHSMHALGALLVGRSCNVNGSLCCLLLSEEGELRSWRL
jgi:hypothetical protein